jgi:hypothetical protein
VALLQQLVQQPHKHRLLLLVVMLPPLQLLAAARTPALPQELVAHLAVVQILPQQQLLLHRRVAAAWPAAIGAAEPHTHQLQLLAGPVAKTQRLLPCLKQQQQQQQQPRLPVLQQPLLLRRCCCLLLLLGCGLRSPLPVLPGLPLAAPGAQHAAARQSWPTAAAHSNAQQHKGTHVRTHSYFAWLAVHRVVHSRLCKHERNQRSSNSKKSSPIKMLPLGRYATTILR